MDDRAALFANVLSAPADDTARLVLADWLDENGEGEFGRFLRAGVRAAQIQALDQLDDPAYYDALRTITEVTTAGIPAGWLAGLGIGPDPLALGSWVWDNTGDRVTVRIGPHAGVFTRGLLSELIVPLQAWYDLAARALESWPLERGTITDIHGLSFWIEPPGDDPQWRLTAAFTVQPQRPRPRGVLGVLVGLFGSNDPPPPVPVNRWAASLAFLDRPSLVWAAAEAWPELLDEVRAAAGDRWTGSPYL